MKSIDLILKSIGAADTGAAATGVAAAGTAAAGAGDATGADAALTSSLVKPSRFAPLILFCSLAFRSSK